MSNGNRLGIISWPVFLSSTSSTIMGIEIHEAANLFPMEEDTIYELAQDIKENGQDETIKFFDGKLLDGRRRWKACEMAGIDPMIEEIKVDDTFAYVFTRNLHRRNLNTVQRALIVA